MKLKTDKLIQDIKDSLLIATIAILALTIMLAIPGAAIWYLTGLSADLSIAAAFIGWIILGFMDEFQKTYIE